MSLLGTEKADMPWTQLGPASEPAPPAGRGDATQPDPAVIERAIGAATEAYHDAYGDVVLYSEEFAAIAAAVRAAAGMLVPATAEQIVADLKAHADLARELHPDTAEVYDLIAKQVAEFAAGLLAGATGGNGNGD